MSSNLYILFHGSLCKQIPDHTGTKDTKKGGKILMTGGNEHTQIWQPSEGERATTYIHALTRGKFADHQKENR